MGIQDWRNTGKSYWAIQTMLSILREGEAIDVFK